MEKASRSNGWRICGFWPGEGRYVDDIAPEGALHAYFLRSPVALGTIEALDVSDERDVEVVEAVFTIADLETYGIDIPRRNQ